MTQFPIPESALANHIATLGKTGSGKTSTGKLIVEHAVEQGDRVCILDPIKSDWWGITSSGDGKKPGLPFTILGGPHGALPLPPTSGKALGQLVGSGKLPLSILDMADFEKAGDLQGFFSDFAASLMRHMRGVLYLVLEEAHEFAPKERAGFGNENQAIHFAKKLATAGRSKGIRLIVATQRVQALHNAVLGSCETMIAHRLTTAADQDPVLKWVKANAGKDVLGEVTTSLSSLPTGTAWVVSGEAQMFERVAFPKFSTFDNTATPDRGDGEQTVVTAAVDEAALRDIIGAAVDEAKANDPKTLKAEIARLTKELMAAQRAAPVEAEPTDEQIMAHPEFQAMRQDRDHFQAGFEDYRERIKRASHALGLRTLDELDDEDFEKSLKPAVVAPVTAPAKIAAPRPVPTPVERPKALVDVVTGPEPLNPTARAVAELLKAIAPDGVTWDDALLLTGRRPGSGDSGKARKSLIDAELMLTGTQVTASDKLCRDQSFGFGQWPAPEELVDTWTAKLRGPGGDILADLYANGPATREEVGRRIGKSHTSGWFGKGMKDLSRTGIVTVSGGNLSLHPYFVRAAEE